MQFADWTLHIKTVINELGTALGTAELQYLWHVDKDREYDVIEPGDPPHGYFHETEDNQ